MNISEPLEKIENGLGVLFHLGRNDDGMTMTEARHLVAVLQVDLCDHVETIRDAIEDVESLEEEAMRAEAELEKLRRENQLLTGRIKAAIDTLKDAGDRAISASVAHNAADSVVTGHIAATAVRIGIAKRELQGLDELLERELATNE